MGKKLAIRGHATRGNEVIELLEMMGGENVEGFIGTAFDELYTIEGNCITQAYDWNNCAWFTLEEFLEKYPFKVGDVIRFPNDMVEEIAEMKWDEYSEDILYTSASGWTRLLRAYLKNPKSNKQKVINMEYKVGDKVRVKSLDWYNDNKDSYGFVNCSGGVSFTDCMKEHCGKVRTISKILREGYYLKEDSEGFYWTDEMIKGKLEEETNQDDVGTKIESTGFVQKGKIVSVNINNANYEDEVELQLEDYKIEFRDGKIYAVRKKPKYPKTYKECLEMTSYDKEEKKLHLLEKFKQLLICRNAYWKIAGEELGLDGPWKPDWKDFEQLKYCIWVDVGDIILKEGYRCQHILTFPTEEMRDAFYENFKNEIEQCQELL